jgi:hypothetical protein
MQKPIRMPKQIRGESMSFTDDHIRQIAEEVLRDWLRHGLTALDKPNLTQPSKQENIILNKFPKELADKLSVEKTGEFWKLQLDHYYKDGTWEKVSDIVKGLGGKWVKNEQDAKNSCWMI